MQHVMNMKTVLSGKPRSSLTEQGVIFESKDAIFSTNVIKYPLADNLASKDAYISIERSKSYLIIYLSKEKFSSLTGNYEFNVFYLADENARNGVYPFDPSDADLNLPTDLINN